VTAFQQLMPGASGGPRGPEQEPAFELDAAAGLIASTAMSDTAVGGVGVEIEGHVFATADLHRPVDIRDLEELQQDWPRLPGGGRLSVEPGGQLEVSSACVESAAAAVVATRADVAAVRSWLADRGLAWVLLGADPIRPPCRVNPAPRYAAMRDWFDAAYSGSEAADATTMMCSTAAVQVNLDAGHPSQWRRRVDRAQRLAPVLTALTGSSTYLRGADTGWCSARQRAWAGLDPLTAGPLPGAADPAQEWTERALDAPVMFIPSAAGLRAAPCRRTLREWVSDPAGWPAATAEDVRRHLTTLFPPVRLRGWLELRCMDSLPDAWWPAVVVAVVAWMDRPELDLSVETRLAGPSTSLATAARLGVGDPQLRRLTDTLLTLAVPYVPAELRSDVEALIELVRDGRTPGSVLAADMRRRGPAAVVQELIHG
jgi:glutamate--cysteine ligase